MLRRFIKIVTGIILLPLVAGFSVGFFFTIHSLMKKQSDLEIGGVILSLVIIVVLNIFFITLSLKILDPRGIHFIRFLQDSVYFAFSLVKDLF